MKQPLLSSFIKSHSVAAFLLLCSSAAFAGSTSQTINGITYDVHSDGGQQVSSNPQGISVTADGDIVEIENGVLKTAGQEITLPDYSKMIIDTRDWGLKVTADATVVLEVTKLDALKLAVEAGDANAMNSLGVAYLNGDDVEKNPARAMELYQRAAAAGNVFSASNLAFAYWEGNHVPQDRQKAVVYARQAAEGGNSLAQLLYGVALTTGTGVEKDIDAGLDWYRKAAEAGERGAEYRIGLAYAEGTGVEQDWAEAESYYRRAAEQGDERAALNLGLMYRDGNGVTRDLGEAGAWLTRAVDLGSNDAAGILDDLAKEQSTEMPGDSSAETPVETVSETPTETTAEPLPPEPPLAAEWWYAYHRQRVGPVSLAMLRVAISEGRVVSDTLVWAEGMADWAQASSIDGLMQQAR